MTKPFASGNFWAFKVQSFQKSQLNLNMTQTVEMPNCPLEFPLWVLVYLIPVNSNSIPPDLLPIYSYFIMNENPDVVAYIN
jgi:hypothetical protein